MGGIWVLADRIDGMADREAKLADRGNFSMKMVIKSGCSEVWSLKYKSGSGGCSRIWVF
jgi:hypothetical protein